MEIVAHRGLWYNGGPEQNTIAAFQAAYDAGCRLIELDVHMTRSGVPVVVHNWILDNGEAVGRTDLLPLYVPTLAEVAQWARDKDVMLFVELKSESLTMFGAGVMNRRVRRALGDTLDKCVIISFVREAIEGWGNNATGWVITDMKPETLQRAKGVEFLIIDKRKITGPLDPQWDWMVYTVDDQSEVAALARSGARYIETNRCDRICSQ